MDLHTMASKIRSLENEMWQKAPSYKIDELRSSIRRASEEEASARQNLQADVGQRILELLERIEVLENPPTASWRLELWRFIEPHLSGKPRGYLGAWILEGRFYGV